MSWFSEVFNQAKRTLSEVNDATGGLLTQTQILPPWVMAGNAGKQAGIGFDPYNGQGKQNIDQINRSELSPTIKHGLLTFASNKNPDEVAAEIARATNGEGKYAGLNRSYKAMLFAADRPGASQLFGSSQSRAAAQGGMLTTQNTLIHTGQ